MRCGFSVLEISALVLMHQGWISEEHVESVREDTESTQSIGVLEIAGVQLWSSWICGPTLGPWVLLACWVLDSVGVGGIRGSVPCPRPPLAQLPRDVCRGWIYVWALMLMTGVSDRAVKFQGPWINNLGCSIGWKKL